MQYKKNIKIIIDKRKLDTLLRLKCPIEKITTLIFENKLNLTGDCLIDDNLESLLEIKEFNNWGGFRVGAGRHKINQLENQDENQLENQVVNQDVDKDIDISLSNNKTIIDISNNKLNKKFIIPTLDEVKQYCLERNNDIDAQRFIDYYEARGWMIGKNKMKSWKAAIRTWEGNNKQTIKDNNSTYRMA